MRLTEPQLMTLEIMNGHSKPISSYSSGQRMVTLEALERKGLVAATRGIGSMFSPQTAITWRITTAGRQALPQNDKMWAMLTEVADQARYHGLKLASDDWKLIFLDGLKRTKQEELRFVPNLDGTGFVNLSTSSSDLSKDEMGELIELIHAWGAQNGVTFADDEKVAS